MFKNLNLDSLNQILKVFKKLVYWRSKRDANNNISFNLKFSGSFIVHCIKILQTDGNTFLLSALFNYQASYNAGTRKP